MKISLAYKGKALSNKTRPSRSVKQGGRAFVDIIKDIAKMMRLKVKVKLLHYNNGRFTFDIHAWRRKEIMHNEYEREIMNTLIKLIKEKIKT